MTSTKTRQEKKLETRQLLLDALLHQSLRKGFAGVSLRNVTKKAGVAPNAFYSHFRNLEDIGLILVREGGNRLQESLRQMRAKAEAAPDAAIRDSVIGYLMFVQQNSQFMEFFMRERSGGSYALRMATAREIGYFIQELAEDFKDIPPVARLTQGDQEMLADLVVNTVMSLTMEILELRQDQTLMQQMIIKKGIKQLRLIFQGALHWNHELGTSNLDAISQQKEIKNTISSQKG